MLLPPGVDDAVQLGGAAALVWDVLEEPTTEDEASVMLARACGEEPERIRPAVIAVLRDLEGIGAVESREPSGC
jgi:hypothetical protein